MNLEFQFQKMPFRNSSRLNKKTRFLLKTKLNFQQKTFLGNEESILIYELKNVYKKMINKNRMSFQIIENGKNKANLIKRLIILVKNLSGTYTNFDQKIENKKYKNEQIENYMKTICVLPGFQNIAFESFKLEKVDEESFGILKVAGFFKSENFIGCFVYRVSEKRTETFWRR